MPKVPQCGEDLCEECAVVIRFRGNAALRHISCEECWSKTNQDEWERERP